MKNKDVKQTEQLPTLKEAISHLMGPGETLLTFKLGEIRFDNPLSPIKSLEVSISSTEARDMQILHKLHTATRAI